MLLWDGGLPFVKDVSNNPKVLLSSSVLHTHFKVKICHTPEAETGLP